MKIIGNSEWQALTPEADVLVLKYSFGLGTANSIAARLLDNSWVVVSPPRNASSSVYDALDGHSGSVSALVAPNAFHNMGQSAWRARFPRSVSYAPAFARKRLSSKTPHLVYHSIEQRRERLAPLKIFLPTGMKSPDMLIQIASSVGPIWWMGDQFSNTSRADATLPLRLLARLAGSGLGFRVTTRPELVYVNDRIAWLDSIRSMLDAAPPSIVVPAHGDPVKEDAANLTLLAMERVDPRTRRRHRAENDKTTLSE